jgi:hypothetical protein
MYLITRRTRVNRRSCVSMEHVSHFGIDYDRKFRGYGVRLDFNSNKYLYAAKVLSEEDAIRIFDHILSGMKNGTEFLDLNDLEGVTTDWDDDDE